MRLNDLLAVVLSAMWLCACSSVGEKKPVADGEVGDAAEDTAGEVAGEGVEVEPGELPGKDEAAPPDVCTPQCDGKVCGPNGCNGTCGVCAAGENCDAGQCVAVTGCDARADCFPLLCNQETGLCEPCNEDAACGEGFVCDPDGGECVACVQDTDCAPGFACIDNVCIKQVCPAVPCPDGYLCDEGTGSCVQCFADADCPANYSCADQACVPPASCESSKDCALDQVCDKAAGICVQCVEDADCDEGFRCTLDHVCEQILYCSSDKDCKEYDKVCDKAIGECVDCLTDADCAAAAFCLGAVCLPDACDQAAVWPGCVQNQVAQCNANGSVLTVLKACAEGEFCANAECLPWVCQPAAQGCEGNTAFLCNDEGSDYVWQDVCGEGFACAGGECKEVNCEPGASACLDKVTMVTCGQDPAQTVVTPCGLGKFCDDHVGECALWVCAPGQKGCDGQTAFACDEWGSEKLDQVDCAALDLVCAAGQCTDCDPLCGDKGCGPDACGGTCGTCPAGQQCLGGYCLQAGCTGDCMGKTVAAMQCALDLCYPANILSAEIVSPTGDEVSSAWDAMAQFGTPGNGLAPQAGGSYALLATGSITANPHSTNLPGAGNVKDPFGPATTYDAVEFRLKLTAPPGATGFSVSYVFMSVEYEEWIGSNFIDKFYVILNAPQTTAGAAAVVNYGDCLNPNAYSDFTDGQGVKKCHIGINSAFSEPCTSPTISLAGTGFECGSGASGGDDKHGSSTGWLHTNWPLAAGETFELTFHIHDAADEIYDSLVVLDKFQWLTGPVTAGTVKGP